MCIFLKKELEKIYLLQNPAQLKRQIDKKLQLLYKTYQEKKNKKEREIKVDIKKNDKKLKTLLVRKYIAEPEPVSV